MDDHERRRADCERIFREWHRASSERDTEALLALYAPDAQFESPLVPAILDDAPDGVIRGQAALRHFFTEGAKRRPNGMVRWVRDGTFLTNGRLLFWEYPRETPEGDQVDLAEVMDIDEGLIQRHRVYWGWRGVLQITPALAKRFA